ncbi:Clavaminate synthase-like protein [Yamadazyma tenuis ATCC 10573]|uniref:Clavaminate synthase-like protein n=1 Tax=Candida tenuis (strain ATCC 10573 / BCRC 21748 / CBS 615 / JCM 9827 / NBRC 10315 / NRRL Y-1498 / VKM Y-70) TaxID=590646 RepID=G3BA23_CANTC|nr:Clavaminate synthase-like protein [Yamadazyma tenuis ATCC 10573]EGV61993.1 Clavaminate synthase-like protein [Yamadazyma tenuis ATCC 10573]
MTSIVPKISLRDFDNRREEIKQQLYEAATNVGFFVLKDQESPSIQDIEKAFAHSADFFAKPDDVKNKRPFVKLENCGYEFQAQVRPSTGTPDLKESLQLQYHKKDEYWPDTDDMGEDWATFIQQFMQKNQELSMKVLSCLAESLGFESDFFTTAHQIEKTTAQSTLRLLHYPDITGQHIAPNSWRAGAHTDFDVMTVLYQRTGDLGLEVCPGREAHTSFASGDTWYPVEAQTGEIVINIGDMLMSWSDDTLKSNFHRVRTPMVGENQKSRYSIAWFNQANKDVVIQGPNKKYEALTAKEYITNAMKRNFAKLSEKQEQLAVKSS